MLLSKLSDDFQSARIFRENTPYQNLAFFATIHYHKDMQIIWQVLLLSLSFGCIFIWQQTNLSQYTLELLGLLLACYIAVSVKRKNFDFLENVKNDLWGLFILNTVIVLVVLMSGNFSSPVFFLLYFLSFGVAFAYHPITLFVFLAGLCAIFLPYALKGDVTSNFIMLASLVFLSPVAFFFAKKMKI